MKLCHKLRHALSHRPHRFAPVFVLSKLPKVASTRSGHTVRFDIDRKQIGRSQNARVECEYLESVCQNLLADKGVFGAFGIESTHEKNGLCHR